MGNIILDTTGDRLDKLMEDRGITSAPQLSEEMFGCDIDKTRSINNHRNGQDMKVSSLLEYCDFFDCQPDYLLGYCEEETHALTDVHNETRLSVASIKSLAALRGADPQIVKVLDFLLSSRGIFHLLQQLGLYYNDVRDVPAIDLPADWREHWKDYTHDMQMESDALDRLEMDEYMMSKTFDGIMAELKEAAEEDCLPELNVD